MPAPSTRTARTPARTPIHDRLFSRSFAAHPAQGHFLSASYRSTTAAVGAEQPASRGQRDLIRDLFERAKSDRRAQLDLRISRHRMIAVISMAATGVARLTSADFERLNEALRAVSAPLPDGLLRLASETIAVAFPRMSPETIEDLISPLREPAALAELAAAFDDSAQVDWARMQTALLRKNHAALAAVLDAALLRLAN